MAVTLDQSLGQGNASATSTTTVTTTATVAAGAHVLVAAGRFFSGSSTMVCSGGGLSWTEDVTNVSGSIRFSVFRAPAPSGLASGTVLTVTHTNNSDCIIGAGSFLGIDTTGTVITTAVNNASTAGWTGGALSSTSGNMIFGGAFVDSGSVSSSAPVAPSVELFDKNVAGQSETLICEYKLSVAGADLVDGTWNAGAAWIGASVCYKSAAVTPAGTRADYQKFPKPKLRRKTIP